MKVNSSPGFSKYQNYMSSIKNSDSQPGKLQSEGLARVTGGKTDTVTLSGDAAVRAETNRVVGAAVAEAENLGSAERIAALREKVQSGEYYVSTDDLASAILNSLA